jgi:hypothetical protein
MSTCYPMPTAPAPGADLLALLVAAQQRAQSVAPAAAPSVPLLLDHEHRNLANLLGIGLLPLAAILLGVWLQCAQLRKGRKTVFCQWLVSVLMPPDPQGMNRLSSAQLAVSGNLAAALRSFTFDGLDLFASRATGLSIYAVPSSPEAERSSMIRTLELEFTTEDSNSSFTFQERIASAAGSNSDPYRSIKLSLEASYLA